MAVAVQPHLVAGGDDLARQRAIARHLLADQEERRRDARAREDLEHRRGAERVGAVIECQRVAASAGGAVLDPQRPPQRRPRPGERR